MTQNQSMYSKNIAKEQHLSQIHIEDLNLLASLQVQTTAIHFKRNSLQIVDHATTVIERTKSWSNIIKTSD